MKTDKGPTGGLASTASSMPRPTSDHRRARRLPQSPASRLIRTHRPGRGRAPRRPEGTRADHQTVASSAPSCTKAHKKVEPIITNLNKVDYYRLEPPAIRHCFAAAAARLRRRQPHHHRPGPPQPHAATTHDTSTTALYVSDGPSTSRKERSVHIFRILHSSPSTVPKPPQVIQQFTVPRRSSTIITSTQAPAPIHLPTSTSPQQ